MYSSRNATGTTNRDSLKSDAHYETIDLSLTQPKYFETSFSPFRPEHESNIVQVIYLRKVFTFN